MLRIGMCPNPYIDTEWTRTANPHLFWLGESIESAGAKIVPLGRKEMQQPELWRQMNLDIVHLHWPHAAFNFYVARTQIQKILPQSLVIAWANYQMKKWEDAVNKVSIPIVWQVHDILSHHAAEYNYPADLILHRSIFRCCDGLVLHGEGSCTPVFSFYGEEKPYAIAPLGSYRSVYGDLIPKEEAKKNLDLNNPGKIFAYLGTARPNRNAAETVKAFTEVASENDILLIAGNNQDKHMPAELDSRIHIYYGVVPQELFLNIMSASDFVINDGPNYLTSAIIRTVVGYHRPVIAYAYGNALDYADECAIWIDDNHGGLKTAIRIASEMDMAAWKKLSDAAALNDQKYTWAQNGIACMDLYERLIMKKRNNTASNN